MSTYLPGFESFYRIFASFCIGKLATSSIRVNAHSGQKQADNVDEIL